MRKSSRMSRIVFTIKFIGPNGSGMGEGTLRRLLMGTP